MIHTLFQFQQVIFYNLQSIQPIHLLNLENL
jgi:hypothetical protein